VLQIVVPGISMISTTTVCTFGYRNEASGFVGNVSLEGIWLVDFAM
jgi:hypothetical protein